MFLVPTTSQVVVAAWPAPAVVALVCSRMMWQWPAPKLRFHGPRPRRLVGTAMRSLVCRRCGPSAFGPAPSPAPRPPDRRPRPSLLRKAQKCTVRRERRTGRACALLRLERRCPDPRPTGSRRSLRRCRSRWHPTPNSSLCCMGTASVHPDVCRRLYLAQLVPGRSRALRRRVPAAARHLGLSDERGGRRSLRRRARDGPAGRRGTGRAGRDAARTPPLQGAGPPPPGQCHHQGEDPGLSRVGLEPKRRCAALRRRGGELGSPGWSHLEDAPGSSSRTPRPMRAVCLLPTWAPVGRSHVRNG